MGGGFTTTGLSVNVRRACDQIFQELEGYENALRQNIGGIVTMAQEQGLTLGDELDIHLILDDDGSHIRIIEGNHGLRLTHLYIEQLINSSYQL